jgi:hypothetical protein
MPVPLIKIPPTPATAERLAEVWEPFVNAFRTAAPALQKAAAEAARPFAEMRRPSN